MRQPSPNVSHPERGLGIVTLLIFGGLILGVSLSAMRIIPIYYRYFEIEAQMRAMADKADELSLDEIRYRVSWLMRTNGIPTQEKDLRVFREGQNVILSLKYHEPWEVTLFDKVYLLHDFQFNPVVKRYVVK